MCLEITLSSAAVARGFASYLATLLGLAPSALRLSVGVVQLDPAAVLLIAFLTAILVKGTKESSVFNMGGLRAAREAAPGGSRVAGACKQRKQTAVLQSCVCSTPWTSAFLCSGNGP